ncbi:ComEC/Rec2 family competence protein, partial [Patescibacteria group bacterium]|nr:ComEC/Rec2 family competence protein [Patescibacteria group bacterium]
MRGKLFFIGTGAFAFGVLWRTFFVISPTFISLVLFFGFLGLAFYLFERRVVVAVLCVTCLMLAAGIVRAAVAPATVPTVFAPLFDQQVSFTGTVVADPDLRQKNQQVVVEVRKGIDSTRILVFAPLYQNFLYGERVTISGILTAPTPFESEGGRVFRYDHFLVKKGIFALLPLAQVSAVAPPHGFLNIVVDTLFSIKHAFVAGLTRALPDPYGQLATGLLTGDQHGLGDSLVTTLALSGLIWVVVLAGYHITLIAEGILWVFAFLPKRVALLVAGAVIAAIVFATGASAPSLRGSVMAAFALFAQGTGRTYDSIRALSATLIIVLLWNPFLLAYDQGFQLSVIVTPALIFGTPLLEMRLLWIKSAMLREIVAISTIAQVAVFPLIWWQTGQLGVWAIPANMFVMSFVPLVILLSVVAGFAGVVAG